MFLRFLHIPRKIVLSYPLNYAVSHIIPSMLTRYPQVAKFSGDDVLFSRSVIPYLSRGGKEKYGSIRESKKLWTHAYVLIQMDRIVLPCRHSVAGTGMYT